MVNSFISIVEYTLHNCRPLMESPALECCSAISFMHFPEYLMFSGRGLGSEGATSIDI